MPAMRTMKEEDEGLDGSSIHSLASESDSGFTGDGDEPSFQRSFAVQETRAVRLWKAIVLIVILVAAGIAGFGTFRILKYEEDRNFRTQFAVVAAEVVDASLNSATNTFATLDTLAVSVTAFAVNSQLRWPSLLLPNLEVLGLRYLGLAGARVVGISPLVDETNKRGWERFSVTQQAWIQAGLDYNVSEYDPGWELLLQDAPLATDTDPAPIAATIFDWNSSATDTTPYIPLWQQVPAPRDTSTVNLNLNSIPVLKQAFVEATHTGTTAVSRVLDPQIMIPDIEDSAGPHSLMVHPFFDDFGAKQTTLAGFAYALVSWTSKFQNFLREGLSGVVVVLRDSCGDRFTFELDESAVRFLGTGDLHDSTFDDMVTTTEFGPFIQGTTTLDKESFASAECQFFVDVYPSTTFQEQYTTDNPFFFSATIVLVFCVAGFVFVVYDCFVQMRQRKVMASAVRTNAIVASFFPSNVRDRLLDSDESSRPGYGSFNDKRVSHRLESSKSHLKQFLTGGLVGADFQSTLDTYKNRPPIADLFPFCTVLYGDITGFSAWSSTRQPAQVFTLLETIFGAFDKIARRRGVFKVETIGDCYVAVTGIPDPQEQHAEIMTKFARDCIKVMSNLLKELEVLLGPDTADLSLRIGIHSGPVTAGVLRGEKSRFQLFGDTVNLASRMERTGERNQIHVSQETADYLVSAGKNHWVIPREDKITTRGKGDLQTYWIDHHMRTARRRRSSASRVSYDSDHLMNDISENSMLSDDFPAPPGFRKEVSAVMLQLSEKAQRLVDWNTETLLHLLKQIVATRAAKNGSLADDGTQVHQLEETLGKDLTTPLDEVVEIIKLPPFDAQASVANTFDPDSIDLGPEVEIQLRDYLAVIASKYRDNPFHNFEHASHVTMSVNKLLSRIVAPDDVEYKEDHVDNEKLKIFASDLHDHTYGITSDPLTHFAVVFTALCHDVDHPGIPNAQLKDEDVDLSSSYNNKSIAEQHSLDIAWDCLMQPKYDKLRSCIYTNEAELKRFRQLLVNVLLATDIADKELQAMRKKRWEKAFQERQDEGTEEDVNRKATIVLEHLIQASDVAHTMQHWFVYTKWNERLFEEMYSAYLDGRSGFDPSKGDAWYKGEIGFYDFYIIPLAKKLKDCGVFGVSSDEYLNYAMENRREWEEKGRDIVKKMVAKYQPKSEE